MKPPFHPNREEPSVNQKTSSITPPVQRPQFSILQAQLKRHQIDCYKILNTQYYSCIHRPSSTRCLIYFWDAEWKLAGDTKTPVYRIAQIILNKLANQVSDRNRPKIVGKASRPPIADAHCIEEIAP